MLFLPNYLHEQIISYEVIFSATREELTSTQLINSLSIDIINIKKLSELITKHRILIDISIGINVKSLIDKGFICLCIDSFPKNQITLQVKSNSELDTLEFNKLISNVKMLQENGIRILVDNFGEDINSIDLATKICANSVRFSKEVTHEIEKNYNKFRYLSYLYNRASEVISKQIIFHALENKKQELLVSLFSNHVIYSNNKCQTLESVILTRKNHTIKEKKKRSNLLISTYNFINSEEDINKYKVMNFIRKNDWSSLIYNSDYDITMSNFRQVYFKKQSIKSNMLVRLLYNSTKPIVFYNQQRKVIYKNKSYKKMEQNYLNVHEFSLRVSKRLGDNEKVGTRHLKTNSEEFIVIEDNIEFNQRFFYVNTYTKKTDQSDNIFDPELGVYTKSLFLKDVSSINGNRVFFLRLSSMEEPVLNIFILQRLIDDIKGNLDEYLIVRYSYDEFLFFPSKSNLVSFSHFIKIVLKSILPNDLIYSEISDGFFETSKITECVRELIKTSTLFENSKT
ncbi:EAL domain-containing protein [Vibrio owensii]|uniref:EAL domain-containing protein n=1 Tax=Vibrio owensii TaxID=696485 RepID=UPI003CE51F64